MNLTDDPFSLQKSPDLLIKALSLKHGSVVTAAIT